MRGQHVVEDRDVKLNWAFIKKLLPYLFEYKARIGLALLFLILAKVASIALPFVLKHIVDSLNSDDILQTLAVPIALVLAYGGIRLFNVLSGEIRDTLFGRVTERAIRRIGLNVFNHLHSLDLAFHLNRRTGGLSRDIERGTSGVSFLMRFMVFNIIPTVIEISLVIGIFFVNYGIYYALITLAAILAYILYSIYATEWRTKYVRAANQADSSSNTRAVDSLLNYETVKYFGNERYEADRYDIELDKWETAKRKNRLTLFALNGGQALIITIAMTAMMMLAAMHVADGIMTIGDFVLINAFMMQLFMPLNFLGFVYREIKASLSNIERMFALMDVKPTIQDEENAPDLVISEGRVSFANVSFGYSSDRQILKQVSFSAGKGQKVAIVGSSGAGKSTILKLLFRFYDPDAGAILIDGKDIRTVNQLSLRSSIGVVPQDTVLFNNSLEENIRYGRPSASDEEVAEAIKMAYLDDFIQALPEGLNTNVGERGLKLSGGEKQRVAIARTLLKQPPIVVMDEATSSLDSRSEQAILRATREIAKRCTTIVIAHRLSTIVDADIILVMEKGAIIEQGSHDELLAEHSKYAELWELQQKENQG